MNKMNTINFENFFAREVKKPVEYHRTMRLVFVLIVYERNHFSKKISSQQQQSIE